MRWTHIDEHLVGDIVIVDLRDPHLMQLDPEGRLAERIRRLLGNGQTQIVINPTDPARRRRVIMPPLGFAKPVKEQHSTKGDPR